MRMDGINANAKALNQLLSRFFALDEFPELSPLTVENALSNIALLFEAANANRNSTSNRIKNARDRDAQHLSNLKAEKAKSLKTGKEKLVSKVIETAYKIASKAEKIPVIPKASVPVFAKAPVPPTA